MFFNRRILVTSLVCGFISAIAVQYNTACGQPGVAKPTGAQKILALIGKPKSAIESVLGKPQRAGKDTDGAMMDWSVYAASGTQGVLVRYSGSQAAQYEISFAKTATWQTAVKALGIDATRLKPGPMFPGMTKLAGHSFKDWNLYFCASGAHYPNGGNLINTNQGLPMIEFEQKSLNE